MNEYQPCPRCGSRILNRLQYYDICACQIHKLLEEEPASEREARWLKQARRLKNQGCFSEARSIAEAVLMDHPTSEAAQELLGQYEHIESYRNLVKQRVKGVLASTLFVAGMILWRII